MACVADVILIRLVKLSNVCEAKPRSLFWAPSGLNELPEMRFDFLFHLIDKIAMAFISRLLANHSAYSNHGTQVGP